MNSLSAIEPLESRIAPAVTIANPLFDITAGVGQTGATIDLATIVDDSSSYRTIVEFITNYTLPNTTGPAKIVLELFDDKAPLSVQNFLSYVNGRSGANYDGTFFHRIFDFGSTSETGTDIIQAGGFDVSNIFKHIPTGLTVHNEFNASDPEVQNVRGTIAMAKTAVSPHTGTSEWFINLTNNTSILGGDNNGGFTVFGRITEGFDVIDAIGSADKKNISAVLSDLPVQDNYVSGTPKANQLFQIVDARVLSPEESSADGHIFSVSVSDESLVTATIVNNELKLVYAPGATGIADVNITVTKDNQSVTETFSVTIKPNLITELNSHTLPQSYVPGDKGSAKVKVSNNTGGLALGTAEVRLYLSEVIANGNDPLTFAVDPADQLLATKLVDLNLRSGKSLTIPMNFTVADSVDGIVLKHGKQYVVIAETVGVTGGGIDQLFTDDDSNALRTGHSFFLSFGKVGNRSNVPMTIEGPDGQPLTFKLSGGGTGTVTVDSERIIDLSTSATSINSVLSVKTPGTTEFIDDVTLNAAIGSVKFGSIGIHGHFAATGGAKSITLGNLGDPDADADKDLSINVFPIATQKVSLIVGDVHDYSLASSMPVAKISAKSWLNDEAVTATNQIFAPSIDRIQITGDFEPNVLVSTDANLGNITIGGALRDASIKTQGDIGVIKLGSLSGATILAGLNAKPDELTDFASNRLIGSFTVTGAIADSVVAAARFNSIVLGSVDSEVDPESKGIFADAIKSYLRKLPTSVKLNNLDTAGTFDPSDNYAVNVF